MAVVSLELSTSCMANQWLFWSLWMTCIYGKRAIFIVYLVPVWASGLSAFNFICSAYTWAQMPTKQIAHGILAYNINNVSTHQVVLQKVQQFWKYYLDKWQESNLWCTTIPNLVMKCWMVQKLNYLLEKAQTHWHINDSSISSPPPQTPPPLCFGEYKRSLFTDQRIKSTTCSPIT